MTSGRGEAGGDVPGSFRASPPRPQASAVGAAVALPTGGFGPPQKNPSDLGWAEGRQHFKRAESQICLKLKVVSWGI